MSKYGIRVDLGMRFDSDEDQESVAGQVEAIIEHLIDLEDTNCGLVDSTIGLDLGKRVLEAELTVEAATRGAALDCGVACLRAAIHAAGGGTPDWDDEPETGVVAFLLDDDEGVNVRQLGTRLVGST